MFSKSSSGTGRSAMLGGALVALLALATAVAPAQLKISQVSGMGANIHAQYLADYVELYNPTNAPVTMANWTIQYAAATGTTWSSTGNLNGTVPAKGYFLVSMSVGTTASMALPTPDAISATSIAMSAVGFKVALCNNNTLLTGGTPFSPAIVDFVGTYQSTTIANFREPFLTGTPNDNAFCGGIVNANFRRQCGAQDTDNNAADFVFGWPSPRNTSTPPNLGLSGAASANPHFVEAGFTTRLICAPQLCGGGLAGGTQVLIDLSLIGGLPAQTMFDDGTNGDELAGDGLFSRTVTVTAATTIGTKNLPVAFSDGVHSGGCYLSLIVNPTSTPDNDNCATAQAIAGPYSPPVNVTGNLTGATAEWNPVVSLATAPTNGFTNRNGLWYTVTGTGNSMTASTCPTTGTGAATDTQVIVFCGSCDGMIVVANNDTASPVCATGSLLASATWCSVAGNTYYVWVGAGAAAATTFTLQISDNGAACTGAVACGTCAITAPVGATVDDETYLGNSTNDGCDVNGGGLQTLSGALPYNIVGTARGYGSSRDVDWYRFQATSTGLMTATLTAQFQGVVSLHQLDCNGNCAPTTSSGGAFSTSSAACGTTVVARLVEAGQWYAVRVLHAPTPTAFGGVNASANAARYLVTVATAAVPSVPNDLCASAVTLPMPGYLTGTTEGATNDGASTCDPTGRDAWFTVTTTIVGTLNIDTCGSSIDTVLTVYSGACGALTEVACSDDCTTGPCVGTSSCVSVVAAPIGTYRIRVSDKGLGAGGVYRIRASLDNDTVDYATALTCPATLTGAGTGYSADSPAPPACFGFNTTTTPPTAGISLGSGPSRWYSVVSPTTQTLVVALSGVDMTTAVYSGTCDNLVCVAANDDANTTALSRVAWVATAGTQYFIRTAYFTTTTATWATPYTLALTCAATPSNDSCGTPVALSPAEGGAMAGTTVGSTTVVGAAPACGTGAGGGDVWYSYTACATGTLTLSTCGAYDTALAVHSTCPNFSSGNLITGACNDNGPTGCTPGSSLTQAVVAGTTYLIRVASNDASPAGAGNFAGGSFTLTWSVTGLVTMYPDADNDGFGSASASSVLKCPNSPGFSLNNLDCNDGNALINPNAVEVCDGVDNNCNGQTDEGVQSTFYQDADSDGFGNAAVSVLACSAPTGYVANSLDCNDANSAINPNAAEVCDGIDNNCNGQVDEGVLVTFYLDNDGDGYGNVAVSLQACSPPAGYVSNAADCDDGNSAVHPGAAEICNGIDDDCDGLIDDADPSCTGRPTWYADADGDGFGDPNVSVLACTQPVGYVANNGDCNDSCVACHPGAPEICDGFDNDCNGQTDEICPSNDFCANATPIGDGTFSGDSSIAATQLGLPPVCFAPSNDLWFSYSNTGICPKTVTASTCPADGGAASFDVGLAVFSGSCASLVVEACNNDVCGTNAKVTFVVPAGETRLIMVAGAAGSGGTFTMVVSHSSASSTVVGVSCPGPTTLALSTSVPVLGQFASINLVGANPAATGLLLYSGAAAVAPPAFPPLGCLLYVDPMALGIFTVFTTDAFGNWTIGAVVPNTPALECAGATFQALVVAPVAGGLAYSNGVSIVFGY